MWWRGVLEIDKKTFVDQMRARGVRGSKLTQLINRFKGGQEGK